MSIMASSSSQWKYCFYVVLIVLSVWASKVTSRTLTTESTASSSMHERHQQWMTQHKIVYKDSAEQERRFEIFKTNVEYIESFNNGGNKTYKLGINGFADQSDEEFNAQRTGLKMPSKQQQQQQKYSTQAFTYGDVITVPISLDWREKGAVTPVKDQGACGCCWAFSSVAAIEGAIKISTGNLTSLSEQALVDCDNLDHGCGGGYMDNVFLYLIRAGGIPSETDYGYTATTGTCDSSKAAIHAAKITGFEYVPINDEISLLKAVANQPISVGIDSGEIGSPFRHYSSGVFTGDCGTNMNHAVTIVGYGESDGTKYWLAKNSWGSTWGEQGYVKLKRFTDSKEGLCGLAQLATYPIV